MNKPYNWHKEVEKQWNDRAEYWNENSQQMWEKGSRKTIIPFLQNYLSTSSHVADLGCGDGYGSAKLHDRGYQVTGVDISQDMIARAKGSNTKENIQYVQGDITRLPFKEDTFDGVMAINCLEWTEVPAEGLSEMKRILKPGGKLCIGVLGPTAKPRVNSYPRLYGKEVICNTMMPWELEELASENGWKLKDGHGVYKREVKEQHRTGLPDELLQSLTFMWVFLFENIK
ncbi:class I SAM-dependent methyltransferase [Halobacillus rhizosphaerae]|uniref:class I SAM-dependent methyltransferase n=1 Tax=Halobacillus rhizosphaerae TaxID=3064889 RepID=UPI00398B50A5